MSLKQRIVQIVQPSAVSVKAEVAYQLLGQYAVRVEESERVGDHFHHWALLNIFDRHYCCKQPLPGKSIATFAAYESAVIETPWRMEPEQYHLLMAGQLVDLREYIPRDYERAVVAHLRLVYVSINANFRGHEPELLALIKNEAKTPHERFCAILVYESNSSINLDEEVQRDDEYKLREIATFLRAC